LSREKRIELLLQVAEERGQEATRALVHRRQLLDEAGGRLDELLDYRESCARVGPVEDACLGASLRDHWRFLSRLNDAISEQHGRIKQQRLAVEQSMERCQEAQRHVSILEKVRDRVRATERRARERREQRVADDLRHGSTGVLVAEEV
jgi:flagellar export protein FliJ